MAVKMKPRAVTKIRAKKAEDIKPAVLLFGAPGSGKTRTIAELLNREKYVLMLHFGFGSPGTKTIREYLSAQKKDPWKLMNKHFRVIHMNHQDKISELCKYGFDWIKAVLEGDEDFLENLEFLIIEEFNSAQSTYERSLVPEMADGIPRMKEAKDDAWGHYGNLKMGTEFLIFKLMQLPLHHVWTAHEDSNPKHVTANDGIAPWIQTNALVGFMGAFPFAVRTCRVKRKFKPAGSTQEETGNKYYYRLAGETYTKAQIENCPPRISAEPAKLWDMILGEKFQSLK